ncbi:MAG: hypothetical protein GTN71_27660 [Anaerolineae bacterium]|nr:hypothetical protein [Anaerolineae bacterium]
MSEINSDGSTTNKVAIAAIIVVGLVLLACIVACSAISIAFILNAPWPTM